MSITLEQATQALATVDDPEIKKDLVTLNMVKDIEINGDAVNFTLELTTPACPLREAIENDCKDALIKAGAKEVNINTTARVRSTAVPGKREIAGVKNIIAVSSGKGGVGKSTVTVNLALALAQEGAKVGILDADITAPNIPLMLGIKGQPEVTEDGKKMLPLQAHGIGAISMGMLIDDNEPVTWRGPMLHKAIGQFFHDVAWDNIDYLIIDLPPGTGDAQISICQTVPLAGVVIVSTPQEVAILDSRKGLNMFKNMKVPVLGMIENMSYFVAPDTGNTYNIFGQGGVDNVAEELGTECLGQIPLEINIREGGDSGQPLLAQTGINNTKSQDAFKSIAQKIAAKISIQNLELAEVSA